MGDFLLIHRTKEIRIGFRCPQFVQQEFHGFQCAHGIDDAAQNVHLGQDILAYQQIFLARAGLGDIDGLIHAFVLQFSVQDDFAVPGSLEFFENNFVHFRTRIDQRRRNDGQ